MSAFYNENDPKAAAWLRQLIKEGHIAPGVVDERSITEIQPHDLTEFTQHHFFAGIGGWPLALRLAGFPDSEPVRTASCPCQPFSIAGHGRAERDERHLWPVCRDLLAGNEPSITFGEQVTSPLGREWFAGVRTDLEALGYEVGGSDLCAAGVAAPHPRQRLYWVANPARCGRRQGSSDGRGSGEGTAAASEWPRPADSVQSSRLEHANGSGSQPGLPPAASNGYGHSAEPASGTSGLGNADKQGLAQRISDGRIQSKALEPHEGQATQRGSNAGNFWSNFDICHFTGVDAGKTRRIEPGTFPLAHGFPERMGLLRGYGNAIVPHLAAEFIQAALDAIERR